ncbi:hypothetical protein BKG70_09420 [Mycobacteroides chelonae]|nr:hypothetical protein BKG66_08760 [Mycobacteroides chelonae]OHT74573.1 hypothetical protein BKG67_09215 [Mycobacteroides chelonae]OHT89539.1 hypothetical protein BKG70_09420 [Mycobacteroides chelonae]
MGSLSVMHIHIDRESVAMGDDVESHAEVWNFRDDARLGDVLVRIINQHFLASVAGEVAWKVFAQNGSVTDSFDEEKTRRLGYWAGKPAEIAMLFVSESRSAQVSWTNRMTGARARVADEVIPHGPGEYHFYVDYVSGGRAVPFAEFRDWVQLSDDEYRAQIKATRARLYPQFYDENGEPRQRG